MDKKINIVMFSMSHYTDWQQGRVNRNYHVLNQLQRDDRIGKIVSIDFLPFNWRKTAKVYWENVIWPMKDLEIVYGDLTSACHQVNESLYIYSTIDSIYSHQTVCHEVEKIIKILNLDNVVFWSYNPLFTKLLECISGTGIDHKAFVFDAVDNWLVHPAFTNQTKQLQQGYKTIEQLADLVFTVSDEIAGTVFAQRSKPLYHIPNGIDPQHFAAPSSPYTVPAELADLPRPLIGYHGIIENRVDLELVAQVAQMNPDKSFVLIGSGVWSGAWRSQQRRKKIRHSPQVEAVLGDIANVHLLPFVPYQDIPQYLHAFDAAIVPHKINEFTKSMNPLKFYEYSAAGKPIITRPLEGVETFRNVFYLADTAQEFSQKIDLALSEDSDDLRQLRREVVADDSWQSRVQVMLRYLFQAID